MFLRGLADSFARVAELSKPTKLKMTKGSAENTPLKLKAVTLSCGGSMTVPWMRTKHAVMTMMMLIETTSRIRPRREDNLTSRYAAQVTAPAKINSASAAAA